MHNFMGKLTPPRNNFSGTMLDVERELMRQHAAYWSDLLSRNEVLLFGPVDDPNGVFGRAVASGGIGTHISIQCAEPVCVEAFIA